MSMHRGYFLPLVAAAGALAAANFVWFIIACRRWKRPDVRTSVQAFRDARRKV